MKIELKPAYRHIVEKPYLCGPACVQMILIRRNLSWIDQEEIAAGLEKFGVTRDAVKSFTKKLRIVPKKDAGIYMKDFAKSLPKFFRKRKLPLRVERYFVSKINDVEKFIIRNLKEGNDIIANVRMEPILKKEKAYGHYLPIQSFSKQGNKIKVEVCDVYWKNKSFYEIDLKTLIDGMSKKWDGVERGFLVIKE